MDAMSAPRLEPAIHVREFSLHLLGCVQSRVMTSICSRVRAIRVSWSCHGTPYAWNSRSNHPAPSANRNLPFETSPRVAPIFASTAG